MSKYEYAYYDSERRLIAVADIREESKKDPHIYMQRYEGHLLCPECKQARLIVVQGADFPFFRAAPRSAHRDGCDFIRPEYVPTTTDAQNPANAKTIRSQLRRALAKTIERQIARADHAGFFKEAAFYGGTALRIFYGLDRFSEDLDFSLMTKNPDFDLKAFFPELEKTVRSFGLNVDIAEKEKTKESAIRSAFLKGNTKEHYLLFYSDEAAANSITKNETIKIKFEIDTMPPDYATFEREFPLTPFPYEVNLYDMPSLFAGKIHAVLCRAWHNRVKGRDLYDYVFYLSKGASVNLKHLQWRLIQSEVLTETDAFNIKILRSMLCDKFDTIDYEQAKQDVKPFIRDTSQLDIWSAEFFKGITNQLH